MIRQDIKEIVIVKVKGGTGRGIRRVVCSFHKTLRKGG